MATGATKLIYITLGIMFLALGVIGLLIPILPGFLFLAGAVYMLSRGSQRVKRFADDNDTLRNLTAQMSRMQPLSILEKVQVTVLAGVRSTVNGMENLFRGVARLF